MTIDGANRALDDPDAGLLAFSAVTDLTIERCTVSGSSGTALALSRVSGRVTGCRINGAAGSGLAVIEAVGLSISGNEITDCGEAGVSLTRWTPGEDGSLVSDNRIERIASRTGAGGRAGSGVLLSGAGAVIVSGNRIADCAAGAIHASASPGLQLVGNSCLRSGGTAIEVAGAGGALVSGNVIDGAAAGIRLSGGEDRPAVCQGNVVRALAPAKSRRRATASASRWPPGQASPATSSRTRRSTASMPAAPQGPTASSPRPTCCAAGGSASPSRSPRVPAGRCCRAT
ncbi:right-handed parallel beta-helix repeat-containing protein [Methylobrevis pamukkalensis]|uniref:right-handed parallel beta-helix repeat-containing protein n=1 Tax=Methylobrevis pamukkalensis TaxID=1439726 RepID=UPI000AABF0AE|nr:right-handed parallel beta-helix repeat-containing protein [Methylobrevis pamukkalensis]